LDEGLEKTSENNACTTEMRCEEVERGVLGTEPAGGDLAKQSRTPDNQKHEGVKREKKKGTHWGSRRDF